MGVKNIGLAHQMEELILMTKWSLEQATIFIPSNFHNNYVLSGASFCGFCNSTMGIQSDPHYALLR